MKRLCRQLRSRIAEGGPQALRHDEAAEEHLVECDACLAFLEAAAEIEGELAAMEPLDAPDEWVAAVLERVQVEAVGSELRDADADGGVLIGLGRRLRRSRAVVSLTKSVRGRPLGWGTALAALLLLVVLAPLLREAKLPLPGAAPAPLDQASSSEEERSTRQADVEERRLPLSPAEAVPPELGEDDSVAPAGAAPEPSLEVRRMRLLRPPSARADAPANEGVTEQNRLLAPLEEEAKKLEGELGARGQTPPLPAGLESAAAGPSRDRRQAGRRQNPPGRQRTGAFDEPARPPKQDQPLPLDGFRDQDRLGDELAELEVVSGGQVDRLSDLGIAGRLEAVGNVGGSETGQVAGERFEVEPAAAAPPPFDGKEGLTVAGDRASLSAARAFLADRERVDDLSYQPASGYWANTYVPGDPALRLLELRLRRRSSAELQQFVAAPLRLHEAARRTTQPFDPPTRAALALYLHADRPTLQERERRLLQVGLQGTERQSGRRPAMNLALVLDLRRPLPAEVAAALRSLVAGFARAREHGDRFRLIVAGRPGGVLVEPRQFRHGPLSVAMSELLEERAATPGVGGPLLGLEEALVSGVELVNRTDDPTAPLGSSAVILVTAQTLGTELPALERQAHRSAVGGVSLSTVGVGPAVDLGELDRLALAGQGNRRLLESAAEADRLVERELSAVSRVIARAVRLRIRLAPGVELVDVVGSYRLDEVRAERVREAELSIDRRLARNLGITADRGEDEEGIQIVLPSFYAGDSHVVLLDVVTPRPSLRTPLADVTVRYKDLVHLRNGVARAHLSLGRGEGVAGPLERNVLKNYLAYRLHRTLEEAGAALGDGDPGQATQRLRSYAQLLGGLRRLVPGLEQDADTARDLALLGEYLVLLDAGAGAAAPAHLADSLRYAGRLKVLPPPSIREEGHSP